MIPRKIAKFLKRHKVYYQIQAHPETYSACATAEAEHTPGGKLVKAVMVKADGKDVMAVLPSNRTVDLFKLSTVLKTNDVRIATEQEFKDLFPDCEVGAMPPFGHIYGVPSYADESLWDEDELFFNAGNHKETVSISTPAYFHVAKAVKGDFSVLGKKIAA